MFTVINYMTNILHPLLIINIHYRTSLQHRLLQLNVCSVEESGFAAVGKQNIF